MYRVRVLVNSRSGILPSLGDLLDMVEAVGKDAPVIISEFFTFFDERVDQVEGVTILWFARADVTRPEPAPVQVDGGLMGWAAQIAIRILPKSLVVLIPSAAGL